MGRSKKGRTEIFHVCVMLIKSRILGYRITAIRAVKVVIALETGGLLLERKIFGVSIVVDTGMEVNDSSNFKTGVSEHRGMVGTGQISSHQKSILRQCNEILNKHLA